MRMTVIPALSTQPDQFKNGCDPSTIINLKARNHALGVQANRVNDIRKNIAKLAGQEGE